jgi:hypothetical protein
MGRMGRNLVVMSLALPLGCTPVPTRADSPPPGESVRGGPAPVSSGVPAHPSPAKTVPVAADRPTPPPEPAESRSTFPPANVAPPHEHSARAGDGEWQAIGVRDAGDRAAEPPRVLAKTVLHPHPTSRFITVTIAAIDLSRTRFGFVPGTDDPKPANDPSHRAGLVPPETLPHAVAVFNGGFQPQHGWWGMRSGPHELVRPRNDGCTIALFEGGRVEIAPWPDIEGHLDGVLAYRQTPPCMVSGGELSSRLTSGDDRVYGGKQADLVTRRRSGIGISAGGRVLFFAISEEGDARHLAEGLRLVGSASAAQLDINWNWTRFLLVGDTKDGVRITSTLLPKMNHGTREYVERPSQRDFFFVARAPATTD